MRGWDSWGAAGLWGAVVVVVAGLAVPVAQAAGQAGGGQAAATQSPRIAMEVDTTAIHVGDRVSVRLSVDHPDGWAVVWPDSVNVSPFEVLDYVVAGPEALPGDGGTRAAATLTVTSFELGELEIPPIEVAVADPGGAVQVLSTDPFRIGVESVGLDESGDIREIKGPLSIARNWWTLAPWLLLVAAVGAGAVYMRRRARSRPVAEFEEPKVPPRPFHLVALEALDELEKSSWLERGQVKRWHVRVSEIIRTYVEGQLEVPALEMTTGEVVAGLRGAALGGRVTETFHAFLARCDLVKFAKLRPGADESRALLGVARSLVRMTSGAGPVGGGGPADDNAAPADDNAAPPTIAAVDEAPGGAG
ncbi:MAG: hypothetical protein OXU74_03040 [Gemmatimonadota bacterium]|nr:hypothetical protein [Gemmatimonadota bacterium]